MTETISVVDSQQEQGNPKYSSETYLPVLIPIHIGIKFLSPNILRKRTDACGNILLAIKVGQS